MTFIERRKGDGHHTLDRRRTYIDVVERVLGNSLPSEPVKPGTMFTRVDIGQSTVGSTISEVQVYVLGDVGD